MQRPQPYAVCVFTALLITLTRHAASAQPVITFPGGDAVAAFGGDVLTTDPQAVRRFDANTGALLQTYPAPSGAPSEFGMSIAVVGGNILVGAPSLSVGPGSAYLYDGTTGDLLLTLEPAPVAGDYSFGWSVAALGSDLLVGMPRDDTGAPGAGAVHLFDGATGVLLHSFHNPDPLLEDDFGLAVAAVGDDVLVGAPGRFDRNGRAFLFDGPTGALLHTFTHPAPFGVSGFFGRAVAAFGGDALVGAFRTAVDNPPSGAAFLFDAATGTLVRTFPSPVPFTTLGSRLSVSGNTILFGGEDFIAAAALIDGTTGALLRSFAFVRGADEGLGRSVAIVGGNAVLGSPPLSVDGPRAAHLFCGGTTPCGPCETCDSLGGCTVAPAPTCRPPAAVRPAQRPRLRVRNLADDDADKLSWIGVSSIPAGTASVLGDFNSSDYTLCAYDESAPTPTLLFRAAAPAGGECSGRPCWSPVHAFQSVPGARYRDRDRTPDGIRSLLLRTLFERLPNYTRGVLRGSRIVLKAAGPTLSNRPLGLPALPLPLPLRVQLQAREGMCWEARYSAAGVVENTVTEFQARPD
jgi:hypothetical protein